MMMNFDTKTQILFESFEMFKDDWENNSSTLKNIISTVVSFDLSASIQMWIFLLKKHDNVISVDSNITSEIFELFSENQYNAIFDEDIIIESLFSNACEPWNSIEIVRYFLRKSDYYNANVILEKISMNNLKSKYNFSEYKTSNISTSLYYLIDGLYSMDNEDMNFLFEWISRVEDKIEQMKLKVLLLSKEDKNSKNKYLKKNNEYLLEGASIEEIEFSTTNRQGFEIKKIVDAICNNTIGRFDFSKLDINWLQDIFKGLDHYSEESFNIVGAYKWYKSLSWDNRELLKDIYFNNLSVDYIVENNCSDYTIHMINNKLELIKLELNTFKWIWNFNFVNEYCEKINSLCTGFEKHLNDKQNKRNIELYKHDNVKIDTLLLRSRINNILEANGIFTITQLVNSFDEEKHIDGLGDKSIKEIKERLLNLNIVITDKCINDDFNYVFKFLGIEYDLDNVKGIYEIEKKLHVKYNSIGNIYKKTNLITFLNLQLKLANELLNKNFKNKNQLEYLELLRYDEKSINIINKYFLCIGTLEDVTNRF